MYSKHRMFVSAGKRVETEEELQDVFRRFFRTPALRKDAVEFVVNLDEW